jgi:hypothetical protein
MLCERNKNSPLSTACATSPHDLQLSPTHAHAPSPRTHATRLHETPQARDNQHLSSGELATLAKVTGRVEELLRVAFDNYFMLR